MSTFLGNMRLHPVRANAPPTGRGVAVLKLNAVFDATGDIASHTGSPGLDITSEGSGVYAVSYPKVKRVFAARVQYFDASGGVDMQVTNISKSTTELHFTISQESAATFAAAQGVENDSVDVVLFVEHD